MEKVVKAGIREHVIQFIQNFRILLLSILGIIVVGVIGAVIFEEMHKSSIVAVTQIVEELDSSYEALLSSKSEDEKKTLIDNFTQVTKKATDSYKGTYAEQRAVFLNGSYQYNEKQFSTAETLFVQASEIFPSSYLAPISLMNASFAAEDAGNTAKSIEYLTRLAKDYEKTSAQSARALFNLGRLYENNQNWKEASDSYKKIIDSFPGSNWTKLARDRIIYLKSQQKL